MDPTVRLLTANDVEAFRRIRLEALRLEPASFASSLADWEGLGPAEWQARMTGGPIVAAFRGEEPVGLMGLLLQRGSRMAHRATLVMVYLREDARGTGLAARMLGRLLAAAQDLRVRQVELHASVENAAALGFYRKMSFVEAGRISAGFIHEGRELEEILMVRRLADSIA